MSSKYLDEINRPTAIIHTKKMVDNLKKTIQKAKLTNTLFRPHVKTIHDNAIAKQLRKLGITALTVSSVEMAEYFAKHGWKDICIAFPVNPREIPTLQKLSKTITLHVIVDQETIAKKLSNVAFENLNVWIDIDAGYGRSGVPYTDLNQIISIAKSIKNSNLTLNGILTHAGDSYQKRSTEEIIQHYRLTLERLKTVQNQLKEKGLNHKLSYGDTPGMSVLESYGGLDEVRPGNLIFYDLMQCQIGSCKPENIALAVACPVVSKYPHRNQILIHGGAVHFSKETLVENNKNNYGKVIDPDTWKWCFPEIQLTSISQEHGLLSLTSEQFDEIQIGDVVLVHPVHSCLTMNLLKNQFKLID